MNVAKLFLIVLIFIVASVAWFVLGRSISSRTQISAEKLGADVDRMFGPRIAQPAPGLGVTGAGGTTETRWRPPDASEIDVDFEHENRYRGLVWFSVYRVRFDATYTFDPKETDAEGAIALFHMQLPAEASIDALSVETGGEELRIDRTNLEVPVDPSGPATVRVAYTTAGQDAWEYLPRTDEGGLRNFRLTARTNFAAIDYPATGLSPTTRAHARQDGREGAEAEWAYAQMLPAKNHTIGVVMPSMPASGALSARIARFAPVSLFFFFVVMVVIQLLKGWKLHPMNYLLIAAGFFAFHILLAYLVDHLPIHWSFWIAAAVSVFLVVSYLRLVLGARSAILVAGGAQLIYLVFFSYAFFWEGWTGLTVVIGAIVTLFVLMQLTGRIDWDDKLPDLAGRRRTQTPAPIPAPGTTPTGPPPLDA